MEYIIVKILQLHELIFALIFSSSVECLRNLACSCLKDSDTSITLGAIKV